MKSELTKYIELIEKYCVENCEKCFREPKGKLKYPFIVPGSAYAHDLWDWDSWLTDLAIAEALKGNKQLIDYEKGCILNFLDGADSQGRIPIMISNNPVYGDLFDLKDGKESNVHKPCLAQHALFICRKENDYEWLKDKFDIFENFIAHYENNTKHPCGLFYWVNDFAIGVDNEPCTFYRPDKSTGSIYLNCLMYAELLAVAELAKNLGLEDKSTVYAGKATDLKAAIQAECWDERDGFFYSADLNLRPIDKNEWLHSGAPRSWNSLPMRIGVWTGFLAMWCGLATEEQAKRIVEEHLLNDKTFNAKYGVRSLSVAEKMYSVKPHGNPSEWLGPIWGNCNYMVFEGLLKYGYIQEAKDLAIKTVTLFGQDIEACGEMHEYYDPDTGYGVFNQGFQSWNLLSYNMAQWLKNN